MSEDHEVPSFSLDLLSSAIESLGGEDAANELGAGLSALSRSIRARIETQKGNATAQWLALHGRATRLMLVEHLSHKLPTSRRVSVIEDHVQTFLCRLVERDTLAPYLADGKNIQPSVLRIWAYQSACTEMRGWGVDASLRKSRGAKTNRDRMADAGKLPVVVVQSTEAVVERRYEIENGETVTDLHDPLARTAEDAMIAEETLARAKKLVANAGPQYASLLESLLDGKKRGDLASETGLSPARVSAMLTRIREVLRSEATPD